MANTTDKLIFVAACEEGYLEKKSNSNLDSKTANAGSGNYTKYWRDIAPGMNGQSWCNCFVNWCFTKAFGSAAKSLLCSTSGWSFYTPTSAQYFKNNNRWKTSDPRVGDVIYFKNSTRIHHVGIVYKVDATKVYTIEGNTSSGSAVVANGGGVFRKSYALNNSAIAGYGRPKFDVQMPTAIMEYHSDNAEQVKVLQNALNQLANQGLVVDGHYGTATMNAIMNIQKLYKKTATGKCDEEFISLLKWTAGALGYNAV